MLRRAETDKIIGALHRHPRLGALVRGVETHPRCSAWMALAVSTCLGLVVAGRNANLTLGPWLVLFTVSFLVSGVCIMIVASVDPDDTEGRT